MEPMTAAVEADSLSLGQGGDSWVGRGEGEGGGEWAMGVDCVSLLRNNGNNKSNLYSAV